MTERTLRKRRQQLLEILTRYLPAPDAEYLAEKAMERAREGKSFQTNLSVGVLSGDVTLDLTDGVFLTAHFSGNGMTMNLLEKIG